VAAAAFAPFIAAASPELLGLDEFASLEQPLDFGRSHQQPDFLKWRAFRDHADSRFVGLTLPQILIRRPYQGADCPPTAFVYSEEVAAHHRENYLWANAAFAFAAVVIRAYATSGWFADIRGANRGVEEGGLVTGLPSVCFGTDPWGVAVKMGTEVAIGDVQEKDLCKLGLIPLCDCKDTGLSVFYANPSTYQPKTYDDSQATASDRMESMLQYTLCASRFAHYLKVLGQNKIGSLQSTWELENYFNNWLVKYVTSDSKAPPSTKAKYPLKVAEAQVVEMPGRPGSYRVVMRLCPHYQLDQLNATIRLVPQLRTGSPG
jgi:type VI secretion system ImpC/EvpB family protein